MMQTRKVCVCIYILICFFHLILSKFAVPSPEGRQARGANCIVYALCLL